MTVKPSSNNRTWFLLGREPLLSTAELFSLLKISKGDNYKYAPPFLIVEKAVEADLMNKLGGTIKIAKELGENLTETELLEIMRKDLFVQTGKITFGISLSGKNVSEKQIEQWGKGLKKTLKSEGRSVRYVFKNELTLSSVTVEKNDLIKSGAEFLVEQTNNDTYRAAKTIAVQPFESFGNRDFGRPGRDSESGMLPPKLALMMINLTNPQSSEVLLDPFCGSGTIISESRLRGIQTIFGSDLSEKAVSDTKQNLDWQTKNQNFSSTVSIVQADATKLGETLPRQSIDIIVTEPYLGKPLRGREPISEIENQANELTELYLRAFKSFQTVLRPGSRLVFIIPQFITNALPVVISSRLVPELKKIGFVSDRLLPNDIYPAADFLLYRRPDQRVAREIWRFKFLP